MRIIVDDLKSSEIAKLLEEHIQDMRDTSPPESKHALDLEGLRSPEITMWSIWDDELLLGCISLKQLNSLHGEIKSMRVAKTARRRGLARELLLHLLGEARSRGYQQLSLETGAMPFFEPARQLYASFGFVYGSPFANYKPDPNSVFMHLRF